MTKDRHWREGNGATAIVKAAEFVLIARAILLRRSRRRKNCCSAPSILPQPVQGISNWIAILLLYSQEF